MERRKNSSQMICYDTFQIYLWTKEQKQTIGIFLRRFHVPLGLTVTVLN